MSKRIFHGLLERVGGEHAYQKMITVLLGAIYIPAASAYFCSSFLFYQNDYVCPHSINNCQEYVCSLLSHSNPSIYPLT
jgi:hypothetical protein